MFVEFRAGQILVSDPRSSQPSRSETLDPVHHHHTAWTLPGFPRLPIDGVHRPIRLAVGRHGKPGESREAAPYRC